MFRPLRVNFQTWSTFDDQQQPTKSTLTDSTDAVFLSYQCVKTSMSFTSIQNLCKNCVELQTVDGRVLLASDLVVPRTSLKIGDRAFSVAAPQPCLESAANWLELLRLTASFKSKLESFLFRAAYTGNTVSTLECTIGLVVGGALQVTVVTVSVSAIDLISRIC